MEPPPIRQKSMCFTKVEAFIRAENEDSSLTKYPFGGSAITFSEVPTNSMKSNLFPLHIFHIFLHSRNLSRTSRPYFSVENGTDFGGLIQKLGETDGIGEVSRF